MIQEVFSNHETHHPTRRNAMWNSLSVNGFQPLQKGVFHRVLGAVRTGGRGGHEPQFNTVIGADGIGLSQGQKQRILIARAVYKNPDFIFLDEATNALDADNERKIVENLSKFYDGRTVIVAAHRLSTVKNANQIIVLSDGCIAEVGNHDSLTAQRGIYYNLVKNQLELGS